ncbi:hypothetical protein K8942_01910 [Candidatus Peribacteria bacterium]|nr:MAG: hypothetical protein K8942_01910 [Candidatus Peribacteria bacterium]
MINFVSVPEDTSELLENLDGDLTHFVTQVSPDVAMNVADTVSKGVEDTKQEMLRVVAANAAMSTVLETEKRTTWALLFATALEKCREKALSLNLL